MLKTNNSSNTSTGIKSMAIICMLLCGGCEKQYLADEKYISESTELNVQETVSSHFFDTDHDFGFSDDELTKIHKLLQDSRKNGIDNIRFVLTSNETIPAESQKKAKKKIYTMMHKNNFINSRIIDSGICVYRDAKTGVRIDLLKYDLQMPNCNPWSEYIGDMDTNKHLPRFGASISHNFGEMIVNPADLIVPREYKGPEVKSSISALKTDSK